MQENTTIGIVGSTGRNARAWTEAFHHAGLSVCNLARNRESVPVRPGMQYRRMDLDDPTTHEPALEGVDVLALVTPADPRQVERECSLIEAASRAGVRRIIKLSALGAELPSPISAFARWQASIEKVLRAANMPHVVLRPNSFMQNVILQRAAIESGQYVEPLGEASTSVVDVRDIADVAVACVEGRYDGGALALTGPHSLSGQEIGAVLSDAIGRSVRFISPDLASFRGALRARALARWHEDALVELYEAVQAGRATHLARLSPDVERAIGRSPRSFRLFANATFGRH